MTDQDSRLEHILEVTGLERERFIEVFGAHWCDDDATEYAWNADEDPDGEFIGWPATPWYHGGRPVQLMLRAFGHGVFVAEPEGFWSDHELRYRPGRQLYLSVLALRGEPMQGDRTVADVQRLVARRRRSFRRCRYCWNLTPPEKRIGDTCMGCAESYQGVVF